MLHNDFEYKSLISSLSFHHMDLQSPSHPKNEGTISIYLSIYIYIQFAKEVKYVDGILQILTLNKNLYEYNRKQKIQAIIDQNVRNLQKIWKNKILNIEGHEEDSMLKFPNEAMMIILFLVTSFHEICTDKVRKSQEKTMHEYVCK